MFGRPCDGCDDAGGRNGSTSGEADADGHRIFVDALSRFARQSRDLRLQPILRRLVEPVRVAVRGRAGVGRTAVAAALSAEGVAVTADDGRADLDADVAVLVIAEVLKPEERAALAAARAPTLVVLNKADLSGVGDGGPMALAQRRAARYQALSGVPTVAMSALLATARLDDELVHGLRTMVTASAELTSTDAFVEGEHPVPGPLRRRLLDTLDRFGVAHAVLAIAEGAEPASLAALLRGLSQIDRVRAHLDAAAASVHYLRARRAITEMRLLAVGFGDSTLADFLVADQTVLAVMGGAVDVVEAAGVTVDRGDDPAAHLRRAVHWQRYSQGPVDALHRACGHDISRGSLRLLSRPR